jgi:HlyD family secretion protein
LLKQLTRGRLIGLIAIVLIVVFVIHRCGSGDDDTPDYQTYEVAKSNVIAKVSTTGTMQAVVTVDVGTQVSGRIQELYADFNSKVKKG